MDTLDYVSFVADDDITARPRLEILTSESQKKMPTLNNLKNLILKSFTNDGQASDIKIVEIIQI